MALRQSAVFGGGFGRQSPNLSPRASQNRRKAPIGTRMIKVFLPKPPPKTALCPLGDARHSPGAEKHSPEDVKTLTRIRNVDRAPQPGEPGGEERVLRLVEEAFDRKRRAA